MRAARKFLRFSNRQWQSSRVLLNLREMASAQARQGVAVPRELLEKAIEANVPQPALRQATFQALLDVLQGSVSGFAALQGYTTLPAPA